MLLLLLLILFVGISLALASAVVLSVEEVQTDSFSGFYPGQFIIFDDISVPFNKHSLSLKLDKYPCRYPAANKSPAPVRSTISKFELAEHSQISFLFTDIAPLLPRVIIVIFSISLQKYMASFIELLLVKVQPQN